MGYNGWKTWDTWNVALWCFNEEGIYRFIMERAGEYTPKTAEETVREIMPNGTPDMDNSADYHNVDWSAIAEAFNEGHDEEEGEG